jgi:N-methylhydantoinase B
MNDRVFIEILRNRFQAIANEMASTILRTGYTVFVKETADYGAGLVSRSGELFAAPVNLGVSVMIGMPLEAIIRDIDWEDGDVVIVNDPYSSEGLITHLPDIYLIRPIFHDDELICFGLDFVHSSDIGGKVPGSISPSSTDIFQEGLRIPTSWSARVSWTRRSCASSSPTAGSRTRTTATCGRSSPPCTRPTPGFMA